MNGAQTVVMECVRIEIQINCAVQKWPQKKRKKVRNDRSGHRAKKSLR